MDNKPGRIHLLVVVLAITSLVFGQRAVSPALADIAKAFPEKSTQAIQFIMTVPSLLIMVSTLICGQLSRKLGKKTLVIIGMILFGMGGISPALFGNLTFIFIMMGILGAGIGFLVPLSQSLLADYFEGRDREVFMGYRSSTASIFGMVFSLLGGSLCAIHWRFTFYTYLIVVPMLLLVLAKMPEPESQQTAKKGAKAAVLTGRMWFYVAMYFLYNVAGIALATNAAFVMTASKIGNARTIGIIMTISSVGAIAAGFMLGLVTKVFKGFTLVFALGFLSLGFIMLNYVNTAHTFVLAFALFGFGFGTFNPTMVLKIIASVPKPSTTLALSILTCALGIGQFISPIFFSFVNGMLGLQGPRASWVVAAACFTAAFVVSLLKTALLPQKAEAAVAQ